MSVPSVSPSRVDFIKEGNVAREGVSFGASGVASRSIENFWDGEDLAHVRICSSMG